MKEVHLCGVCACMYVVYVCGVGVHCGCMCVL